MPGEDQGQLQKAQVLEMSNQESEAQGCPHPRCRATTAALTHPHPPSVLVPFDQSLQLVVPESPDHALTSRGSNEILRVGVGTGPTYEMTHNRGIIKQEAGVGCGVDPPPLPPRNAYCSHVQHQVQECQTVW